MMKKLADFAGTVWARRLVLGLFVAQAIVLAFITGFGTPPDETNHIKFIEYYANHSLGPVLHDQQPTNNLGDKTREVDYLYHYAASFVYRALPLPAEGKYVALRLATVGLALLTMLVLASVFRKAGLSAGSITVGLLVVTNLPMVLLMSSAINNDVFVWLGMSLGALLLIRLWRRPNAQDLLWLAALSIVGGLVKRNLLVIGMMLGILGLIVLIRHFKAILADLKKSNWHIAIPIAVLLLGSALFIERIGGNLIHYKSVTVTCEQVQGEAACHDFWASIRARDLAKHKTDPIMPAASFVTHWVGDSAFNIIDIQTQWWRHETMPARLLTPFLGVLLVVGVLAGLAYERKRFKTSSESRYRLFLMLAAWVYIGMQLVINYSTYTHYHVYGVALNGRYIIPSILILAGLACFYWSKLLNRYPKTLTVLTVAAVLAVVLWSGLIMMLRNPQLYNG
jgi:hypothetical protein